MPIDPDPSPTPSNSCQNLVFDTISQLVSHTAVSQVAATFTTATAKFGFTSFGINGLPPPREGADPQIMTEIAPAGFRELYIHERFYLADHICAFTRNAITEPFRYSEAPYDTKHSRAHRRFMQALQTFGLGKGMVVPVGRQMRLPTCVWMAGVNPDLHDDAKWAMQLIAMVAAAKSYWLASSAEDNGKPSLTGREREILIWTGRGKSAWEIGEILGIAKRTVDEHVQNARAKLGAVNKTQAVVVALLRNIIEI